MIGCEIAEDLLKAGHQVHLISRDAWPLKNLLPQEGAMRLLESLKMAGIDDLGLAKPDRDYLLTAIRVFGGGPVGLEAIAHTMNASPDMLEDEVEPFLLRSELLVRTPRGRVVTAKGYRHLKVAPPQEGLPDAQSRLFE